MGRGLALVPRFERDEHQRPVGRVDAERGPVGLEHDRDVRELAQDALDAARDGLGLSERSSFGQLDRHVEIAEVLVGKKSGRYRLVREVRRDEAQREQAEHEHPKAQQRRQQRVVSAARGVDRPVDRAVEPGAVDLVVAEQQRREDRRQRERVEQRDADRTGDAQRELLVELPGRAGERRDGDEHRQQHQRARDDGAGDLSSGGGRRFMGIVLALSDMALNVFNHDDSVVDDQAGGERDTE